MKVILLEDVDNLGRMGDTVRVKDGYARNYLIPRSLAIPATARNIKAHQHKLQEIEKRRTRAEEAARGLAERLAGVVLTFTRRAGEKGRLFGSVTNMDIASALADKGLEVDRRDIVMPEPIKNLGDFEVTVKLHHDVTQAVRITVLPEEGEIPEGAMDQVTAAGEGTTEDPSREGTTSDD